MSGRDVLRSSLPETGTLHVDHEPRTCRRSLPDNESLISPLIIGGNQQVYLFKRVKSGAATNRLLTIFYFFVLDEFTKQLLLFRVDNNGAALVSPHHF